MNISLQSWEFIFALNIFLVLLLPILLKPVETFKNSTFQILNSIAFRLCIFLGIPWVLSSLSYWQKPLCDLPFLQSLLFWHLGISVLNLGVLWRLLEGPKRIRDYYIIVSISGLGSLIALVATPSLAFNDIYWGVVPGTISLDPIISLPPYYLRAWVTLMTCLVLTRWRKPSTQLASAWIAFLLIGQFAPSPFLNIQTLKRQFKENVTRGPLHIYIQDPEIEEFSADIWAKEFQFHLEQLLKRLPSQNHLSDAQIQKLRFDIFIYASDDEKDRWIHARRTQIGHFLRGEMHLSHLDPSSEIIGHELAHLLHGQLKVAFNSYIDPFYFEGFAVALSDPSHANALDDAAAMAKSLPERGTLTWPRLMRFFWQYPARASYALSGGHSAAALEQGRFPWEIEPAPIDDLLQRNPSVEKLKYAKEIFSQPPLLYDPLRRDCVRLARDYAKSFSKEKLFSSKIKKKLEFLCPQSPALLWSTPPPRPTFTAKGAEPFQQAQFLFYSALLKSSHADSKKLAATLLRKWKPSESSEAQTLKARLEWELSQNR